MTTTWTAGSICVEGMFHDLTMRYYNKLTEEEKEGIDYEYYKKNKHKSTDFISYYDDCVKKREEKKELEAKKELAELLLKNISEKDWKEKHGVAKPKIDEEWKQLDIIITNII